MIICIWFSREMKINIFILFLQIFLYLKSYKNIKEKNDSNNILFKNLLDALYYHNFLDNSVYMIKVVIYIR